MTGGYFTNEHGALPAELHPLHIGHLTWWPGGKEIMIKMLLLSFVLLVGIAMTAPVSAEVGTAVVFLTLAPGARANGMGQGFVAVADDATAAFYNPAGLALTCPQGDGVRCPSQLFLMHSPWMPVFDLDDLYLEYFALTHEVPGWGHFGLGANYLHVGDVMRRDDEGNEMGMFKVYDLAFSLTYSTRIARSMAMGGSLKFIRSQLDPDNDGVGTDWAVDLGWLYRMGSHTPFRSIPGFRSVPVLSDFNTRSLSFGASISNWGPDISYLDASNADPLPRLLRLGFAYDLLNRPSIGRFLLSAELNKVMVNWRWFDWFGDKGGGDGFATELQESKRSVGVEYTYNYEEYWVFLRGGYFYDREASNVPQGPTFGGGLRYSQFQFDFAFISPPSELGSTYTQMYSLTVTI